MSRISLERPPGVVAGLTIEQIGGIFGAQRTGGWKGSHWSTDAARGPEGNIRTWGQLGLTGEWADKEITPYGLNQRYSQALAAAEESVRQSHPALLESDPAKEAGSSK